MKAVVVLFIASLLILGTCQAHAQTFPMKNRHLLSDINGKRVAANKGYSQGTERSTKMNLDSSKRVKTEAHNDDDDDDTSSGSDNHRYFPDQDRPTRSPPRHQL
ncbi:unnamed protein product [Fraxinus pennsylvanica]|uniref:Uncharacterized protein n=1 Tax=Fraxinus pennsylvanica TaxID=56036 RepID=A0AAD1ZV21_9LAMI|nr:unnamed protein product [Fraxinus pennsylvanica]